MKNSMFYDFMSIVNNKIDEHLKFAEEYGGKMDDEQINKFKSEISNHINRKYKVLPKTDRVSIANTAFEIADLVTSNPVMSRQNLEDIHAASWDIQVKSEKLLREKP